MALAEKLYLVAEKPSFSLVMNDILKQAEQKLGLFYLTTDDLKKIRSNFKDIHTGAETEFVNAQAIYIKDRGKNDSSNKRYENSVDHRELITTALDLLDEELNRRNENVLENTKKNLVLFGTGMMVRMI
ncbi:hypothetical protein [Candidatus Liberibacter sp.]|uniref:hypothetical protein n=1 Tax=Candidatus Liberibacter sp. TaxID=34022 RepID=UPI0015F745FC|nr:hypothetical protein [Candidatus Liberibacter sp.]MBA5724506.1 hypothetical protein [Candidatus Liberibacter sp.]